MAKATPEEQAVIDAAKKASTVFNIKDFTSDPRMNAVTDVLGSDASHVYPFDCAPVDIPFGGGIYSGKIYEVWGWESQGKSSLALEMTKAFSNYWDKLGDSKYAILYLETESAFDKVRAKYMGCKVENFIISEVETLEDGESVIMATLEKASKFGIKFLIIWDTIAAAPTRNELAGATDPKKAYAGGMIEKPRVVRKILRNITTMIGKTDATLVLVNQAMGGGDDASGIPSSPSPAIKFHASVRTYVQGTTQVKEIMKDGTEKTVGIYSSLLHYKNKLILPKQRSSVTLRGETGYDKLDTTLRYLSEKKLITMSGSWKSIDYPNGYAEKDEQGKLIAKELISVKYQSNIKVKEAIDAQPCLKEWMDYLVYKHFTEFSPLVKVKIITKVWDYEVKFLGEKVTTLTDEEIVLARMLHKELNVVEE